jgi:hypothetical protein
MTEQKVNVVLKRIYEEPAPGDGTRVLVERLWPRTRKGDKPDTRWSHIPGKPDAPKGACPVWEPVVGKVLSCDTPRGLVP